MSQASPLCCIPDAIPSVDRRRYEELTSKLLQASTSTEELPDGYTFHLQHGGLTVVELAEWISYECRCCPFLNFRVELAGERLTLTLQGAAGTKEIVRSALGF